MFICSANYEENISKPLLDRMDKIRMTSYSNQEKAEIVKQHLIPRAISKTGVDSDQFELSSDTINFLVHKYSMGEPGVRYLDRNILRIL